MLPGSACEASNQKVLSLTQAPLSVARARAARAQRLHLRSPTLSQLGSYQGKDHLYDSSLPRNSVGGDIHLKLADVMKVENLFDIVVMDVTDAMPFLRTAEDQEVLEGDRVIHVGSKQRGG